MRFRLGSKLLIASLEDNLDGLIALCQEYGVSRLELFGSAATSDFDPERSDLDFLVEYTEDYDWALHYERREELIARIRALLGREVDLVILGNVENPYVRHAIEQSRTLLYAA
jgi:predicted nucleotidyltransferase